MSLRVFSAVPFARLPRLKRLDEPVFLVVGGVAIQLLPQEPDLLSIVLDVLSANIDVVCCEVRDLGMTAHGARNGDSTAMRHLPLGVHGVVNTR